MRPDERGGDILGRLLGEQAGRQFTIALIHLDRRQQRGEQTLAVLRPDFLQRRRTPPFGIDACAA